jgi:hypothetical protein
VEGSLELEVASREELIQSWKNSMRVSLSTRGELIWVTRQGDLIAD